MLTVAIVTKRLSRVNLAAVSRAMAEQQASTVASSLNKLSDGAFTTSLSARDRGALATLVEEYFCSASTSTNDLEDEEEEEFAYIGMQLTLTDNE